MTQRGEHVRRGSGSILATCVLTSTAAWNAAFAAPAPTLAHAAPPHTTPPHTTPPHTTPRPAGFTPALSSALPLLAEHALSSVVAEVLGQLLVDQRSQTLTRLSASFLDLDAAALRAHADSELEGRRADEADVVLAIALRAGRPVPPGLSAARRTQRETRAAEALDWLRSQRESEAERQLVEDALRGALDPLDPSVPTIPELVVACCHVVAQLDLVDLAPSVGRLLGDPASDVRGAARASLYRLYGRRFDDAAAFTAAWAELEGLTPAAAGRDQIHVVVELSNERALQLLELAPARFEESPLDWSDPDMPPRAARSIGRAVASGVLEPATARAWLVDGIAAVESPAELHARLGVLLDLVQASDPASPAATEVRDAVGGVLDAAVTGAPEIAFVALSALPRVPFAVESEGDVRRVALARAGALAFDHAVSERRMRPLDPDALQGAIVALRDVLRGVEDGAARDALVEPFARVLLEVVADPHEPVLVRRAAATSLSISTSKTAANALVEILGSGAAVEVEYELLGALRSAVRSLRPGDEEAEQLLTTLFASARDADFDRSSRALELLLSEELAEVLAAEPRPAEARAAVDRLAAEESPALRAQLLHFAGRVGDAGVLRALLETEGLVEDLAGGGDEVARARVGARRALRAGGAAAGAPVLGGARRVAPELGEDRALDPGRVVRLRAALDVVLALDEAEAAALPRADHRWTLRAAIDLRRSKDLLAPALLDSVHRVRLVGVHAQALEVPGDDELDPTLVAMTRGLFGSDEVRAQLEALDVATPEPASAIAERETRIRVAVESLDFAVGRPDEVDELGWELQKVRLESIDFLRAVGRESAALGRLFALFSEEGFRSADAPAHAIRTFAELSISSGPAADPARERTVLAADAVHQLVGRESWQRDTTTVRLQDLSALTELVRRAANPARCEPAIALLERQLVGEEPSALELREEFARVDPTKLEDLVRRVRGLARSEPADEGGGEGTDDGEGAGDSAGGDPPVEKSGTGGGAASSGDGSGQSRP
ncbi:MAG: hypothetical protein AAGB93_23380 [Planctomycetota bacterium]